MPQNKQATIRYQVLDRCFSNKYKRFYIEDLVDACNVALQEYGGQDKGVKKRQVLEDISFMESSQGYSIPLDRVRDGKRVYYTYSDKGFSINNKPISETSLSQFKAILLMLSQFRGLPEFADEKNLIDDLLQEYDIEKDSREIISFEQNEYLEGLGYLGDLYNYIVNQQTLEIQYKTYSSVNYLWTIHPYFLKQYNSRWFLLGLNDDTANITTIALDRIVSLECSRKKYIPSLIDFMEYFDDIIGVTLPEADIELIKLKFCTHRLPYVLTKPIHPSQKIINKQDGIISIEVIPNKELIALLLSFGSDVEILSPESLRKSIQDQIIEMRGKYE